MTQSVATRKDLNESTEIFGTADNTVVDFANLNGRCASFDFLESDVCKFAVGTRNRNLAVFSNLDNGFCFFLDGTNILSARTDQHTDLVGLNLSLQQAWCVLRKRFRRTRLGSEHLAKDLKTSFFRLSQSVLDQVAADAANLEVELDARDTFL